jgi:hypothetical protein
VASAKRLDMELIISGMCMMPGHTIKAALRPTSPALPRLLKFRFGLGQFQWANWKKMPPATRNCSGSISRRKELPILN